MMTAATKVTGSIQVPSHLGLPCTYTLWSLTALTALSTLVWFVLQMQRATVICNEQKRVASRLGSTGLRSCS